MKKLICILPFLCCTLVGLTQERGVKSYSVSELFEMIESEADTIFKLRNAEIVLDSITDQRFKSIGWNDTI